MKEKRERNGFFLIDFRMADSLMRNTFRAATAGRNSRTQFIFSFPQSCNWIPSRIILRVAQQNNSVFSLSLSISFCPRVLIKDTLARVHVLTFNFTATLV